MSSTSVIYVNKDKNYNKYKYKYKYKIKTYNAPYVTRVIRRHGKLFVGAKIERSVFRCIYVNKDEN